MRDLLRDLRRALGGLAASVDASIPAPKGKSVGGRPAGSVGRWWRDCLRELSGPDGANTFGISDVARSYGVQITRTKIQKDLGSLIRAGHIVAGRGRGYQLTQQGLAMLHATKRADQD